MFTGMNHWPHSRQNFWLYIFTSTQSCSSPHETMRDVLTVFKRLNIQWKKIGPYNVKCHWKPAVQRYSLPTGINRITLTEDTNTPLKSSNNETFGVCDAVKFEIQVSKFHTSILKSIEICRIWRVSLVNPTWILLNLTWIFLFGSALQGQCRVISFGLAKSLWCSFPFHWSLCCISCMCDCIIFWLKLVLFALYRFLKSYPQIISIQLYLSA